MTPKNYEDATPQVCDAPLSRSIARSGYRIGAIARLEALRSADIHGVWCLIAVAVHKNTVLRRIGADHNEGWPDYRSQRYAQRKQPVGLGNRRLQIDRSGPFFTAFLPHSGAMRRRMWQKLSSLGPIFAFDAPSPTGCWPTNFVETTRARHPSAVACARRQGRKCHRRDRRNSRATRSSR